jgi:GNAT superfamily N-acetyltransferase
MHIRSATINDAGSIADIHIRSWQAAYRGIMPDAVLDGLSVENRRQFWSKHLLEQTARTLVAEAGDKIIGFADFGKCRDEDSPGAAEVYAIYLDPAYYRRGTGRQLWNRVIEELARDGHERLAVRVLAANKSGRRFYEAMGGQLDQTAKKEDDGLTEIRYWCPCVPPEL